MEELVKRLWECASGECFNCSQYTETTNASVCQKELMKQAADAIEQLSNAGSAYGRGWTLGYDAGRDDGYDAGRDENMPRWIPVEERLPEDNDKRFLVCAKRFDGEPYMHICYHAKKLHEFDEYDFPTENRPGWYFYDSEYGWIEKEDVTHWMPLPEPPKEE